jgi:hypothetical protein
MFSATEIRSPQVCHPLIALDLITGRPDIGPATLKLRFDPSRLRARACARCRKPLPPCSRASTRFCSTACRVAAHRAAEGRPGTRRAAFVAPVGSDTACNAKLKNPDLWRHIVQLERANFPPLTRVPERGDAA